MTQPTQSDGDWIGDALEDILPTKLDNRVWVQEEPQEVEGNLVNKFRFKASNLVVLCSVTPIQMKSSNEKKVSYHVTILKEADNKVKKPNSADISRVRETFFMRELTPKERSYEGTIGNSKAHHIIAVIDQKLIITL